MRATVHGIVIDYVNYNLSTRPVHNMWLEAPLNLIKIFSLSLTTKNEMSKQERNKMKYNIQISCPL